MANVQAGWADVTQTPARYLNGTTDEWWLMISDSQNAHVGRDGTIKGAKIYIQDNTDITTLVFVALRLVSGTTYTLVGMSNEIAPSADGLQTYVFTQNIENVREDDLFGVIARPASAGDFLRYYNASDTVVIDDSATARYRWNDSGDTSGTNPYAAGSDYNCDQGGTVFANPIMCPMMDPPDVMVVGDSISMGSPLHNSYRIDDTDKDKDAAFVSIALRQIGWDWELAGNTDAGLANTFDDVLNDDLTSAVWDKSPANILCHCGVNDINGDRTWSEVEDDLDAILLACQTNSAKLILTAIFPWTGNSGNTTGTHAHHTTRDSWNLNLRKWAAGKSDVTFIDINDVLSKERLTAKSGDGTPPSGNSWDLYEAFVYTTDSLGVHLNATGAAAAGGALAIALQRSVNQYADLRSINGSEDAAYSLQRAAARLGNKAVQTKASAAITIRNYDDDDDLYTVTFTDDGTEITRALAEA